MLNATTLAFLRQLARGIAEQFGPNCEVVVHLSLIHICIF